MSATTPRKKRAKATTDLGRSILQKERQRLAREQAALGEQFIQQSRERLRTQEQAAREHTPEHIAVNRGMVSRVSAVLASEHVNVPIHTAHNAYRFSAWTDFEKISITYRLHEDPRLTAAILRGMLYHEGGHIRFTIPFPVLLALALEEHQAIHGPLAVLPEHPAGRGDMQRAWNGLEDQRMETAVTSDSPRKAVYFTPMVIGELMKDPNTAMANWPLFVWRRYLPKHLRDRARALWITRYDEAKALEVEATVNAYVQAETALDMWLAVVRMTELNKQAPPIFVDGSHQRQGWNSTPDEASRNKLQIPIDPGMLDEETLQDIMDRLNQPQPEAPEAPESDQGAEGNWLDNDDEPEVEYVLPIAQPQPEPQCDNDPGGPPASDGFDYGDKAESPGEGDNEGEAGGSGAGEGHGDHGGGGSFEEVLQEAQEQADTDRYEDKALDGDIEAYENAKQDGDSNLIPYVPGVETDGELIAVAETLAYEIEQTFQASTIDRAPAWVEGQKRGALNVLRYETRKAGDTEFYRAWVDDDQPGYDIAVSVLLDYSGSMASMTDDLAQAGYACKRACDRLAIPCTVVLWDTDAVALWDADEKVEAMPRLVAEGGTDPGVALNDLDNQRKEKAKHIVLVFTDGEWGSDWGRSKSMAPYKDEDRYVIGFGLGSDYIVRKLLSYGCDEAYAIKDLMDIPRRLELALVEHG